MEGVPFCGPAGKVLNAGLQKAGLERGRALVTNVVPTQPPGNVWEMHSEAEKKAGAAELRALLREAPRKLIVAFGEQALHTCLGLSPDAKTYAVTEARGYIFDGPYGKVLGTVHPAFVMRQWHPNWALLNYDLQKAARHLATRGGSERRRRAFGVGDVGVAARATERALAARVVACDIEIFSDGSIACVGFATSRDDGFCFPYDGRYTAEIDAILRAPNAKVFHNGQFDLTILRRNGFEVEGEIEDTMLMWHALEPSLAGQRETGIKKRTEKSLRFLASLLTDEPFWKDYDFRTKEERYVLCAKDARVTLEIYEEMLGRMR